MCPHSRPPPAAPTRRRLLGTLAGAAAILPLAGLGPARAEAPRVDLPAPGPRDICPVCGMFVAKYPEWIATVLYADGHADHFDGAKDFFKYLGNMEKYALGRTADQITGMGVTDYYSIERIDARGALYSVGSDVLGPMGHELIPLATEADAAEYTADHKGKRLLTFAEVTPDLLAALDAGRIE